MPPKLCFIYYYCVEDIKPYIQATTRNPLVCLNLPLVLSYKECRPISLPYCTSPIQVRGGPRLVHFCVACRELLALEHCSHFFASDISRFANPLICMR